MADEREPVSLAHVASSFRHLAEQHARRRAARDAKRAWARIHESAFRATRSPFANWSVRHTGFAFAALVCLSVGATALAMTFRGHELGYEVSGAEANGGLIRADRGDALVSFTDDSSVKVAQSSRLSIDVVGEHAALARLVAGKLHVNVRHHGDTSYRFLAGPYEVRVVGTEFDLAWEPGAAGFSLTMQHGEVRVVGPDGMVRSVIGGEALRLPGEERVAANVAAAATPAPVAIADTHVLEPSGVAPRASAHVAATPSWDALVAKGRFAEVVRDAEAMGVGTALGARSGADLKALGQAARYTGDRALALRAFGALRQRFANSEAGRPASFFIARIQEEQGSPREALRWLSIYLGEAPRGVYAAEALGRRLMLTERVSGRATAAPLAREYLERFPQGAYAASARAILQLQAG
ncbi:MAG TPA: FecR domain-containing protein [Polyangiaceae bacterium]|nr:FecR domain-containing protein [Polyangiaceae bacterium]